MKEHPPQGDLGRPSSPPISNTHTRGGVVAEACFSGPHGCAETMLRQEHSFVMGNEGILSVYSGGVHAV